MISLDKEGREYLAKNFADLSFQGKEIRSATFEACTFKGCDFSEATFKNCNLMDCSFTACNLSVVNFSFSRFSEVTFHECKAIGIDWTKVNWPSIPLGCPIKFYKCILNDSSFFGLSLNEIEMEDCKASRVDFREGEFHEANLRYTDFSGSLFNGTNLTGADFTEAANYQINFFHNTIKKAKFNRCEAVSLLDSLEIELIE